MIISVKPVVVPAVGRGDELRVRVSAPVGGGALPVIVLSHGFGDSLDGYGPLVDYWTEQGFAVVQPTHLDSRTLALPPTDPRTPRIWRQRIEDVKAVIDHLEVAERAVPGLELDRERIFVAGHSWGAQTVSTLLGARVVGEPDDFTDARVKAGVLFAITGTGGADLSPFAAENFSFMSPDFSGMTAPALIVAGDKDDSPLSVRGPDWFTDAYRLSPAPKSLLTLFGAEHTLGGIHAYRSADTTDESPERVALIQRLSTAFLRGTFADEDATPLGETASK